MLVGVVNLTLHPTVAGVKHMPPSGPAILCANHLSIVDPVVLAVSVDRPVFYLGKSEYFRGPLRWFFESLGVMPIAREGGIAGERSLQRGREILEAGALLGIYPEGARSPDGRLYRGKTGAVRLAIRTGAPVVPIGLRGTREVLPPHGWLPRPGPVEVRFGPPLDFRHLQGRDMQPSELRTATDAVMSEILSLSGQSYADVPAAQAVVAQRRGRTRGRLTQR